MEIWDAVTVSDAAFDLLSGFLEEYPIAKLEIDVNQTRSELQSKWGNNQNDDNKKREQLEDSWAFMKNYHQYLYVNLNRFNLQQPSKIFMAAVLAHELIHASMYEDIYRNTRLIQDNYYDPDDFIANFPLLFDLWITQGLGREDAFHEGMAQIYRDKMVIFLRAFDIQTNGATVNSDIYEELSWVGLTGTPSFGADNDIDINDVNAMINEQTNKGNCN